MGTSGEVTCCVCDKMFEWCEKDGKHIIIRKRTGFLYLKSKEVRTLFVACPYCSVKQEVEKECLND